MTSKHNKMHWGRRRAATSATCLIADLWNRDLTHRRLFPLKSARRSGAAASLTYFAEEARRVRFTHLIPSSYIVSHCAKIILTEYPMVIWGKERAWISKQHKAMRNFKGDGTITANKILEANECVCLCLWQWLRGVNRGISSHLRSLNTSHSHNWIKSVRLLLNCRWYKEH